MGEELTVSSELPEGRGRRACFVLSASCYDVLTFVQCCAILNSDKRRLAARVERSEGAVYLLRNRAHKRLRELLDGDVRFRNGSSVPRGR